ncbi:MAG: class I SAM-dependent methyltransferase [Actinomycetota bacterium]|nr:class I SAM-dependent methyltransferase [Actinomycetota bacterium]
MLPPLVERALARSVLAGFTKSCSPETGRLLQVLAGQRGRARVAEIGTGCGVGSAWILSALDPEVRFFTVELDAQRAADAAELLAGDENATVLAGDWRDVLAREAPFDLLFADGGKAKHHEEIAALLAPGGTLFLDDLTPGYDGHDQVRELWLSHPRLLAAELQISPREAVIVGTLQPR